jgi:hypothetical protein
MAGFWFRGYLYLIFDDEDRVKDLLGSFQTFIEESTN